VLKLHGVPESRAFRCLWALEEAGVPYERVRVTPASGDTRKPEFLALNPNGHIPVLEDGDLVLWESLAINLYVATRYGRESGLWPAAAEDQGRSLQWSFWAAAEIEPLLVDVLQHRILLPETERKPEIAQSAVTRIAAPLAVLDEALCGRAYLLGSEFCVADLNVASVLAWARVLRIDLAAHSRVADWLGRCLTRPSVRKAQAR
jgi:glutathione S-transferase